ncbi:unnamed protein product [Caenorhabditis nigoni]
MQAESIEARWFNLRNGDLDRISNFLGPKPLKEFSTQLNNYEILRHPIVRNSQKLVIWRGKENFINWRVSHRNIHLKDYDRETLYRLMNEWIASDPKIGMELTGDIKRTYTWELIEEEIWIKERMYSKKRRNNGRIVKADWRFPNTVYSISMPRANSTAYQYSLIKNESETIPFQIHLKIQFPEYVKLLNFN